MVAIMGGKMEAVPFRFDLILFTRVGFFSDWKIYRQFASLCVQAYLAVRPYHKVHVSVCSLTLL